MAVNKAAQKSRSRGGRVTALQRRIQQQVARADSANPARESKRAM